MIAVATQGLSMTQESKYLPTKHGNYPQNPCKGRRGEITHKIAYRHTHARMHALMARKIFKDYYLA